LITTQEKGNWTENGGSNPLCDANLMEGYLAGDASTALKAVGTERSGDQYHQPSAKLEENINWC